MAVLLLHIVNYRYIERDYDVLNMV